MAKNKLKGLFSSAKDDWQTPQFLYEALDKIFSFEIDLASNDENHKCAKYLTEKENSLLTNWYDLAKVGFLNPPYTKDGLDPWISKTIEESEKGMTVVILVADRLGSSWFADCLNYAKYYVPFYKRLQFEMNGIPIRRSTFANVIFVFSRKEWDLTSLNKSGKVIQLF